MKDLLRRKTIKRVLAVFCLCWAILGVVSLPGVVLDAQAKAIRGTSFDWGGTTDQIGIVSSATGADREGAYGFFKNKILFGLPGRLAVLGIGAGAAWYLKDKPSASIASIVAAAALSVADTLPTVLGALVF